MDLICIFTFGRKNKQVTFNGLPNRLKNIVKFVVDYSEKEYFVRKYGIEKVIVIPNKLKGISFARQYVLEKEANYRFIVFADDDVQFSIRENGTLNYSKGKDIINMFIEMKDWLLEKNVAIAGISMRGGNNRELADHKELTRAMDVYAFDRNKLIKENARFDRVKLMEDFDINLFMIERGYKNRVFYKYAISQVHGRNAKGGCSIYRDNKLQEEAAKKLLSLHPNSVSLVQRISKGQWGNMNTTEGGNSSRIDVKIKWQKAYLTGNRKFITQKTFSAFLKK